MDYNMSDTVTGLGALNNPKLIRNRNSRRILDRHVAVHGAVSIKAGPEAIDTGFSGLGAAFLDAIQSGLTSLKELGTSIQQSVTLGKQIQVLVSPPKVQTITPIATANVQGSPYGVPTGSTQLEPQLKDQSTIDGVKRAVTSIPTSYLVIGGVGVVVLGAVLMMARRPAY